ncbi:MAG TPA: AzlD domain-containing protein [Afipia sp.]
MSAFIGDWNALLILFVAGVLPNEIWRLVGLVIGKRIREDSEILIWVRAVATAILAGVIVQLLLVPPGALALVPPVIRYTSLPVGFAAYLATRKSVAAGVVVGEIYVVTCTWLMT